MEVTSRLHRPGRCFLAVLLWVGILAGLPSRGDDHRWVPRATITDALGQTHTRYEHFYKGIRVWDSEGILHTPAKGAKPWWEGESREPGWELEIGSLMPLAKVQQKVREAQGPDGSRLVFGRSELVIFPVMATQVRGSAGAKANACDQVEYVADHVLAYC